MHKPKTHNTKTHFEQVPLEIVQTIVKEQVERGIPTGDELDKETAENGIGWPDESSAVGVGNLMARGFRAIKL